MTRLLSFAGIVILFSTAARAQTSDDLFDDNIVHEIRLRMHPNDWATLRERFADNTYYAAEFTWQGRVFPLAGIRSRGLGSRSEAKPGLKVDFNRYGDVTFLGLKALVLDNNVQDSSWLRERLSMLLFRRMGLPAPRETYTRLFVNNVFAGLYSTIEDIDKAFLRRVTGDDSGFLYEYKWTRPYRLEELPEDLPLLDLFSPRTNETHPEPEILNQMILAMNRTPSEGFQDEASRYFDIEKLLLHLAVENYVAEVDGLLGSEGMNNFYLYRPKGGERFTVIAWDKDVSFNLVEHPLFYNIDSNVITRRLFESPQIRQMYLDALKRVAETAGGPEGWFSTEVEKAVRQISSIVPQDTNWPGRFEDFHGASEIVRFVVQERAAYVLSEIAALETAAREQQ